MQKQRRRVVESRKNDKRNNSADRHISKLWLLAAYGDGCTCQCVHCGVVLTYRTMTRDRIDPKGRYVRANLQPACLTCNVRRGDNVKWVGPAPTGVQPKPVRYVNPLYLPRGEQLHPDLAA